MMYKKLIIAFCLITLSACQSDLLRCGIGEPDCVVVR